MRKLMILAGMLTTLYACKEEESYPQGQLVANFGGVPASINATPKGAATKIAVNAANSAQSVKIKMEWEGDEKTLEYKSKIAAKLSANGTDWSEALQADGALEQTFSVADAAHRSDGYSLVEFHVKVQAAQPVVSKAEAKLRLTLTSGDVTQVTILNVKGSKPILDAPSFSMIDGDTITRTLWFAVDTNYYSNPDASRYTAQAKVGDADYADLTCVKKFKYDSDAKKDYIGIVISATERSTWTENKEVKLRLILADESGNNSGIADTSKVVEFKVKADKVGKDGLGKTSGYDFTATGDYFALIANKRIAPADADNAAKTDLVFYIDTMAGQPRDSTFVLIMKGSMDSSAMRIVAIDEENKYRTKEGLTGTVGLQQLTTYPVDSVAADTLPDAAEYIPIRGNKFYAVKISAYKVVDDLKVPVTYYGCLKVRTHINPTGSLGNVGYVFGKVELVFNYGEARNWTKE